MATRDSVAAVTSDAEADCLRPTSVELASCESTAAPGTLAAGPGTSATARVASSTSAHAQPENRPGSRGLIAAALDSRGIRYDLMSAREMAARGIVAQPGVAFVVGDVRVYVTSFVRVYVASHRPRAGRPPRLLNGLSASLFKDKALTSTILRAAGLPTPVPYKIADGERINLRRVFRGLSRAASRGLVVKPNRGRHGRHVFLSITTLAAFKGATAAAMTPGGTVIVEAMVPGTIYRFYVVNGSVAAVRYGLSDTGHSNRHQGARIINATHTVHPSYSRLAERAVAQFPGTFIAGVDVAICDASGPVQLEDEPNCHIIEINGSPGILGFHYPDEGDPVDVAGAIVDGLITRFALDGDHVPIPATRILVSGTVQRVGFRRWLQDEARRRSLTGFVRNRSDGTVEAVVSGSPEAVDELVARVRVGPPNASVTHIRTEPWRGRRQRFRRFSRSSAVRA